MAAKTSDVIIEAIKSLKNETIEIVGEQVEAIKEEIDGIRTQNATEFASIQVQLAKLEVLLSGISTAKSAAPVRTIREAKPDEAKASPSSAAASTSSVRKMNINLKFGAMFSDQSDDTVRNKYSSYAKSDADWPKTGETGDSAVKKLKVIAANIWKDHKENIRPEFEKFVNSLSSSQAVNSQLKEDLE